MIFLLMLSCFLISGLTGLIYEVLWTRMIEQIIGTSPFAVSIILTIFMAGLGLGSFIAGKTVDRIKKPEKLIRTYGLLELGIGVYGFALPLLLMLLKPIYAILYSNFFNQFIAYNLLTFIGIFLLILPVTLMGATLPVLVRFFITSLSGVSGHVGKLYGLNTIGAAAGSLLCGFWLINLFGIWGILYLAVALNAVIGGVCILVSRKQAGKIEVREESEKGRAPQKGKRQNASIEYFSEYFSERSSAAAALVVFAVSGFCAMAYEVIWTKLLGLLVGPTTYSFTILLVSFITGLALGSVFFGWLGDRRKNTLALLLLTQAAAAVFAMLFSHIMGNSQIFFAKLIYAYKDNFSQLHFMKGLILFGAMFLPTFCLGAAFPLVSKMRANSLPDAGRSIGYAYAINSIGSVLGSFCAGFVLIPFLGKENSIRLVVGMQLVCVIATWLISSEKSASLNKRILRAIPACACAALLLYFPRWDHVMLSMGKYHRFERPEIAQLSWYESFFSWEKFMPDLKEEKLLFYGDGIGGFTTVLESTGLLGDKNYNLCNSGKPDASSSWDMDTQTLLAHFPMMFHSGPTDALVIGLGSGITAGEILNYPIKRLDILEINEQVVAASKFFVPWNSNVLADKRTHLIIQDGRAHLELSDRKYDLVTCEPSNPWMSGIAALYTEDFFKLVKSRLKENGLFVQWMPAYQMDWDVFSLIGRTFNKAFPNRILVCANPLRPSSFLLIGVNGNQGLDPKIAARNLMYAQHSKNITLKSSDILFNLVASDKLQFLFGDGPINTDNKPILEYSAPKIMHESNAGIIREIARNLVVGLDDKLASIVQQNKMNIDRQIDFAEYFLGFRGKANTTLECPINLAAATPSQRDRYFKIAEDFCGRNVVADFSVISDPGLKERCYEIQSGVALNRLNAVSDVNNKAILYAHLGDISLQNNYPDRAVSYFKEAVSLNPRDKMMYNNLGIAYVQAQRYGDAINSLAEALRIDPNYSKAHENYGIALASQGKNHIEEAISQYREALRLDPEDADVYNNLGSAFMDLGKMDEAAAHFMKALEISPTHPKAQINMQKIMMLRRSGQMR